MSEDFTEYQSGISAPAFDGNAVTLDALFTRQTAAGGGTVESRKIWVGGAGNLSVVLANGSTVVLINVAQGNNANLRALKVTSANTTATNLVAFW